MDGWMDNVGRGDGSSIRAMVVLPRLVQDAINNLCPY